MKVMLAIGLAGAMLIISMFLKAKIKFLQSILVPCCILGGLLGAILMNTGLITDVGAADYNGIVSQMFLISFICVGLTGSDEKKGKDYGKNLIKGGLIISGVWGLIYCLQAIVGYLVMGFFTGTYEIASEYGILCPFGFAQGPGQANTFGATIESYGFPDATSVALTFAVVGFLLAFIVGVPLAKMGIAKGMAKNIKEINPAIARGYYMPGEPRQPAGMVTCFGGSIDTLTFHIALVGLAYFITHYLTKAVAFVCPDSLTSTIYGFQFAFGLVVGIAIRFAMKAFKIEYVKDDELLRRLTGFSTDVLVICAFMAVQFSIVQKWMVPILAVCLVNGAMSLIILLFFCKRSKCDFEFERTLFLWGMSTGTVPSGMSLLRMADPDLKSTVPLEIGVIQVGTFLSAMTAASILAFASGTQILGNSLLFLFLFGVAQVIPLFIFKVFGKKVFSFREGYLGAGN